MNEIIYWHQNAVPATMLNASSEILSVMVVLLTTSTIVILKHTEAARLSSILTLRHCWLDVKKGLRSKFTKKILGMYENLTNLEQAT